MTKLDISDNRLYVAGCKALAEALHGNTIMVELNLANNELGMEWGASRDTPDTSGVIALANAIPTMGALTSLNVSNNALCGINEYGFGTYDASGVTALADAIRKHQ